MSIEEQISILEDSIKQYHHPEFLFQMNLKYRELHEQLKNR